MARNRLELECVVFRASLESADLVSDSETIHGYVSLILPQCYPMMDRRPWVSKTVLHVVIGQAVEQKSLSRDND